MWAMHDRLDVTVSEATCRTEIDSFKRHGQLVPVLGRSVRGDPMYDIELIYGARRLFVARHINKPLLVELRDDISDRDALVAMDIENRQRVDISPYERGQSYARWLREGHFQSQDDISRALKVSASQVSRLLKLARLPSVIVSAFDTPVDICEGWGLELLDALSNPSRRDQTIRKARLIGSSAVRPPAREVYRQLLSAAAQGRKVKPKYHDEIVKDATGAPLFRIRHQTNAVALFVPIEKVSARGLENIRRSIAAILQATSSQTADPATKIPLSHPAPIAAARPS
jgi:ParB family chromosome partitioning protein